MARCTQCGVSLVYDEDREVWVDPTDSSDDGYQHQVETWFDEH